MNIHLGTATVAPGVPLPQYQQPEAYPGDAFEQALAEWSDRAELMRQLHELRAAHPDSPVLLRYIFYQSDPLKLARQRLEHEAKTEEQKRQVPPDPYPNI